MVSYTCRRSNKTRSRFHQNSTSGRRHAYRHRLSRLPKFRKKLPDKLQQIRERAGLTPEEFAPHVHANDGQAVEKYEKGKGNLPVSVLMRYWKLSDVPLENILN